LEKYRLTEMRARVGQLLNEFGLSKQLVVAILGQLIPAAPFKCPGQKIDNAHGSAHPYPSTRHPPRTWTLPRRDHIMPGRGAYVLKLPGD
jgi:hypothetical protein